MCSTTIFIFFPTLMSPYLFCMADFIVELFNSEKFATKFTYPDGCEVISFTNLPLFFWYCFEMISAISGGFFLRFLASKNAILQLASPNSGLAASDTSNST